MLIIRCVTPLYTRLITQQTNNNFKKEKYLIKSLQTSCCAIKKLISA